MSPGSRGQALYQFGRCLSFVLGKLLFRYSIRREVDPGDSEAPALVLGNHQSYLDPFFAGHAMGRRRLYFVAADFLFCNAFLNKVFHRLEIVPIKQFQADPAALRQILKLLRENKALLIFPEGQRCLDGGSMPFQDGVLRLARKSRADIYFIEQKGAYFTWPRWAKSGPRPGKVELVLHRLAEASEVAELPLSELRGRLDHFFLKDDFDWQEESTKFRGYRSRKPARGLTTMLHYCPACGRMESLIEENKALLCKACGKRYPVSGKLRFEDGPSIKDWHRRQIAEEGRRFEEEGGWSCTARLVRKPGEKEETEMSGRFSAEKDGLVFYSSEGEEARLDFSSGNLAMFKEGEFLQIFRNGDGCFVYPDERDKVIRAIDLLLYFQKKADLLI